MAGFVPGLPRSESRRRWAVVCSSWSPVTSGPSRLPFACPSFHVLSPRPRWPRPVEPGFTSTPAALTSAFRVPTCDFHPPPELGQRYEHSRGGRWTVVGALRHVALTLSFFQTRRQCCSRADAARRSAARSPCPSSTRASTTGPTVSQLMLMLMPRPTSERAPRRIMKELGATIECHWAGQPFFLATMGPLRPCWTGSS